MRLLVGGALVAVVSALPACGGSGGEVGADSGVGVTSPADASFDASSPDSAWPIGSSDAATDAVTEPVADAASDALPPPFDAGPTASNIKHVVLIVQENHTFDTYFGRYCTAPAGSNPTCTTGPSCCEAAPDKEASGGAPATLDDTLNKNRDPNHSQQCEQTEMNLGKMDRYVTGTSCSNAQNFAIAPSSVVKTYHDWAGSYALADRYFQPIVGASSSNDMYFAEARHVFTDNAYEPLAQGHGCSYNLNTIQYQSKTTIADLLLAGGHTFSVYAQGYDKMKAALLCPAVPSDCAFGLPTSPCVFDPSDIPFEYYAQFTDKPQFMRDYDHLADDVKHGVLPTFSFVKALQYHDEHPGYGTTITAGIDFVKQTVDAIQASSFASDTLILLTWDEGGGFYDHVSPPPTSTVDSEGYGTRVPLLAIGPFARANTVSHVTMEHSSVVKFLEYNFLGRVTGQLGARDASVNNLGSLLDPAKTGTVIPSN